MNMIRSDKSAKIADAAVKPGRKFLPDRKWLTELQSQDLERYEMMEVFYRGGLYLPDHELWLDADSPRDRCIISHAHGDHIAEHRAIVATPETARLFRHRCGETEIETLRFGERR